MPAGELAHPVALPEEVVVGPGREIGVNTEVAPVAETFEAGEDRVEGVELIAPLVDLPFVALEEELVLRRGEEPRDRDAGGARRFQLGR